MIFCFQTTFGQFHARQLLENLEDLDGLEEKDMVHGFQRLMSDVKKEARAPTSVRETAKYTAPIIRKELQDLVCDQNLRLLVSR